MDKPAMYGILPAGVRYDKRLSPMAKLLYVEITVLLQFNNKCFASNEYFSKLYDLSETQISRLIKLLIDTSYISTEMEITTKGTRRLIKLLGVDINVYPPVDKNEKRGVDINVKHNINSNKNTSLSKDKRRKPVKESMLFSEDEGTIFKKFVESFNAKLSTNFRLTQSLKEHLQKTFKEYSCADALTALENAMSSKYHTENNFQDLTPEFITRPDKLEKYLNFKSANKKTKTTIDL